MLDIAGLLSTEGYVICNKELIRKFGTDCAVIIGELCAEYKYFANRGELEDDMFYSTQDNIEYNTGLSTYHQRQAINELKANNIITVVKRGLPAKNYFKINFDELVKIFDVSTTSRATSERLDVNSVNLNNNKTKNNKDNKVLSKDNTSEFLGCATKPKKQSLYQKCVDYINGYTGDETTRDLLVSYLDVLLEKYRDTGRTLYFNVFKSKVNELDKFDKADINQIIINATSGAWEHFYELKTNSANSHCANRTVQSVSMTEDDYAELDRQIEQRQKEGKRVSF